MFDIFDPKIRHRKRGRELPRERTYAFYGLWVRIRAVHFLPFPQEIDEVSTGAASGVQYSHSTQDAVFQKLVEEINVDLAELLRRLNDRSGFPWLSASKLRELILFASPAPRKRRRQRPFHSHSHAGRRGNAVFGEDLAAEVGPIYGAPVQMMQ
jgi:hypothetical protein